MASPQIKTPAEIIFDNTPSDSAATPASGQTLLGVDETTKKLYSVNDAGVKTNYDAGGGGSGGSGIMGQDEGAPIGTGTILNVTGNLLQLSISGSVLRLNQTDPTFPQEVIGIYGQNQGVPLGTGVVLNVDGTRLTLSISGSVLRLTNSPDPQELIGVFGRDQGTNLGTGTTIDWGLGMNAAISGSVLFVHPFDGGSNSQVWTRNTGTSQGAAWATPSAGTQKGTLELTVATVPLPSGSTNSGAPVAGLDGLSSPFEGIPYYEFVSTPVTYREYYGRLKNYGGGGLTIKFEVLRTSAAAGATYIFEAGIRRINTGTEDLGAAHTYDYNAVTVTIPAGPPNAGIPMAGTITFTNGADMDNLASGEACILRFRRNGGTAADIARVLVTITVEET